MDIHYTNVNMYGAIKYIYIIKHFFIFWCIKYSCAIPELTFGSFIGEDGVRIQTYTLNAEVPLARAILVHGTRSHFAADFMLSDFAFQNCHHSSNNLEIVRVEENQNDGKVGTANSDDGLSNTNKYKTVGTLELENYTINLYEDGTNGWDIQKTFIYDGTTCQALNENNITVHGIDLRSHGRSGTPDVRHAGRVRGLVDDFDNVAKDVITYVRKIREEYQDDLPLYFISYSMGASVAARACQMVGDEKLVEGIVLISPMMKVLKGKIKGLIKHGLWFHRIASKFFPNKSLPNIDSKPALPERLINLYDNDPLSITAGLPYRTGYSIIKLIRDLHKDSNKIHPDTSVLMIHTLNDVYCYYKGTEKFYNSLAHIKKRRLVTLDNVDHELASPKFHQDLGKYSAQWIKNLHTDFKLEYETDVRNN